MCGVAGVHAFGMWPCFSPAPCPKGHHQGSSAVWAHRFPVLSVCAHCHSMDRKMWYHTPRQTHVVYNFLSFWETRLYSGQDCGWSGVCWNMSISRFGGYLPMFPSYSCWLTHCGWCPLEFFWSILWGRVLLLWARSIIHNVLFIFLLEAEGSFAILWDQGHHNQVTQASDLLCEVWVSWHFRWSLRWGLKLLCLIKRNGLSTCVLHANIFAQKMQTILERVKMRELFGFSTKTTV